MKSLELMRKRSEALVMAMVGEKLSGKWWESKNKAFEMRTPEQQWKVDPDSVYTYLLKSAEGDW